ncbi:MAG: hypothetical protein AB9883_07725 [Acidaminococcaceae bacterium]
MKLNKVNETVDKAQTKINEADAKYNNKNTRKAVLRTAAVVAIIALAVVAYFLC